MGVRQPPSTGDTPEIIEFGIAAMDARLDESDLEFPATRTAIEERLGEQPIPYDVHGNEIDLGTVLERTGVEEFESRQKLLNECHPIFEEYRKRASRSLLQQLRTLLPF